MREDDGNYMLDVYVPPRGHKAWKNEQPFLRWHSTSSPQEIQIDPTSGTADKDSPVGWTGAVYRLIEKPGPPSARNVIY